MKKMNECLRENDRSKHIAGGMVIGFGADSTCCAAHAGAGAGRLNRIAVWQ